LFYKTFFACLDWRTSETTGGDEEDEDDVLEVMAEPSRKRAKSSTRLNEMTFYNNIKVSLVQQQQPAQNIEFIPSVLTDDKIAVLNKIRECVIFISNHRCKGNKYYSQIGLELGKLKVMYMEPCDTCILAELSPKDIFLVLNCHRCLRKSNTKEFFALIKTSINYGQHYVNFLIALARICFKYPKFSQVSVPIAEIKKHMNFLTFQIDEDAVFWLSPD